MGRDRQNEADRHTKGRVVSERDKGSVFTA